VTLIKTWRQCILNLFVGFLVPIDKFWANLLKEDTIHNHISGIALGYGMDDRRFESRERLGIFLFITASRQALGPTQPLIQWVAGALSLGVTRSRHEADHLHLVPKLRMYGAIPPLPNKPSCRGAQLKHRDNFTFTYNFSPKINEFQEIFLVYLCRITCYTCLVMKVQYMATFH
jgi:hypothetical protein